jgi:hypothetical protein
MQASRFDTFTRALLAGATRRATLASLLGGTLGLLSRTPTTAKKKKRKKKKKCALLNQLCTGAGTAGSCCESALVASAICSGVAGQPGFNTCCVPSGSSPTAPAAVCATATATSGPVPNAACCSGSCSAREGEFECA